MIPLHWFPAINACLNGSSALLLTAGWLAIRNGRTRLHHRLMVSAVGASAIFLASYLYYHAHAGTTHFAGAGWIRLAYLAILGTHTVLAAVIVPLVVVTLHRALTSRVAAHRRIARVTLPLWMYVSVTGVVIYLMLYHVYPSR